MLQSEIRRHMAQANRLAKTLQGAQGAAYDEISRQLNEVLSILLRGPHWLLTRSQFTRLIELSSTYRPMAPHTILGYLTAYKKEEA